MSDRKLQLQVLFNMVDKLSAPLKSLQAGNKKLAAAAKETRKQIKQLEDQTGKISSFNRLRDAVSQNAEKLKGSARELRNVRRAFQETENPSKKLTAELNRQTRAHQTLLKAQRDELSKLSQVRNELHSNNIDTKALAHSQELLSQKTKLANDAMARQESQLKRNGEMQRQYQRAKEVRNNLAIKGAGMLAVGGVMAATAAPAIHAATEYQQEITQFKGMGVGDAFLQQAQKYADGMNIMGSSSTENLRTIKEAYSILRHGPESLAIAPTLAQIQIAQKMLMANGSIKHEGQDEQNSDSQALVKVAELLGHISSTKDFANFANLAMKANAASGGLVTARDYRAVVSTGGVALSRIDPQAFFFSLSHLIQEKGGDRTGTGLASAYQNMVMGRETKAAAEEQQKIGLLRPDAIQYTKTGQLAKVRANAIVNADLYRADPYKYLMTEIVPRIRKANPKLDEAGMEMAIAKLFSSRTAQDIMVTMYKQRANIDKQITAGNAAQSTQQILSTNKNSAVGQRLNLAAEKANLNKQIGADLMPAYVAAMRDLAKALHWVNTEMKAHPKMGKALVEGIAGVAALTASLGGLALVLAGIIGPFATLRYMWGMFTGGRKAARDIKLIKTALEGLNGAEKTARKISVLSKAFNIVRTAVVAFGESLWTLMANPIIAAITILIVALGIAVYEMWKHWDKVKPWLIKFWNEVCGAASAAWDYLKQKWDGMVGWFEGLPARFKAFGSNIINGLMDGIDEKWQELKAKISKVTDMLPDWMKPSSDENPDGASAPNTAPRPSISYTPLRTAAAGVPDYGPQAAAPVNIHVYPSAGMNEKALAQHAADALKKHQRQQQASARSKLADMD
ncbi:phage tail tape measure protein [Serratia marcescens]|uniref:phage tail tape measure protein n=1 Tax=Serratia marcescens TaxID=615 RepID=UPI004045D7BA